MAHFNNIHSWNLLPRDAIALQKEMAARLRQRPLSKPVETIAGADISFNKFSPVVYAGIVVLRLPTLEVVEEVAIVTETHFPYVPGLLSFRELPALFEAWSKLQIEPDAVMFDGHGIAHPRRIGIAAHAGLFLERPTWGCGKSILTGKFADLDEPRGSIAPLMDKGEEIGVALRTKNKVSPVFVSPGHLITQAEAIDLTLRCDGGYRLPEPTRRAHHLVNAVRLGHRLPD